MIWQKIQKKKSVVTNLKSQKPEFLLVKVLVLGMHKNQNQLKTFKTALWKAKSLVDLTM